MEQLNQNQLVSRVIKFLSRASVNPALDACFNDFCYAADGIVRECADPEIALYAWMAINAGVFNNHSATYPWEASQPFPDRSSV